MQWHGNGNGNGNELCTKYLGLGSGDDYLVRMPTTKYLSSAPDNPEDGAPTKVLSAPRASCRLVAAEFEQDAFTNGF